MEAMPSKEVAVVVLLVMEATAAVEVDLAAAALDLAAQELESAAKDLAPPWPLTTP